MIFDMALKFSDGGLVESNASISLSTAASTELTSKELSMGFLTRRSRLTDLDASLSGSTVNVSDWNSANARFFIGARAAMIDA